MGGGNLFYSVIIAANEVAGEGKRLPCEVPGAGSRACGRQRGQARPVRSAPPGPGPDPAAAWRELPRSLPRGAGGTSHGVRQ